MNDLQIDIMIMSGVDDGLVMSYSTSNNDGTLKGDEWMLTLGRRDDNDLCLRNDTFSSRYHAKLYLRGSSWWLEDCSSKNDKPYRHTGPPRFLSVLGRQATGGA